MISLKNSYAKRAKISESSLRKILKYFAADLSATKIATLTSINRNTINHYLNEVRGKIITFCEIYMPLEHKITTIVTDKPENNTLYQSLWNSLGIINRRGKIYIESLTALIPTIPNNIHNLVSSIIKPNIQVRSIEIKNEDGLIAIGYENANINPNNCSYVDNQDNFWNFSKNRLQKFNGIAKHKLYGHLKECEFRFNFRNDDLYHVILQLLRYSPIT